MSSIKDRIVSATRELLQKNNLRDEGVGVMLSQTMGGDLYVKHDLVASTGLTAGKVILQDSHGSYFNINNLYIYTIIL